MKQHIEQPDTAYWIYHFNAFIYNAATNAVVQS